MGYSICISTPRPSPGDRHFDTGPRGFHFHPGPCIQFSGVERSATPSGPDNVPRRRQSDTGPLRSGPPKAGDRPSRHAGTPAGIPGSAGVSGNPKPGPHSRPRGPSGQRTGTGAGGRVQFPIHHESQSIIYMEAGFVESRAGAAVARLQSTSPDLRLGEWDGGNLAVLWPPETLGVCYPARRDPRHEQQHRRRHGHLRLGLKRTLHLTSG